VIFVFTHDSIGLGEDGPTHQSVEHAASLRLIPGMDVWRPATPSRPRSPGPAPLERDDGPSALLLTRQNVPFVTRSPRRSRRSAAAATCCATRRAKRVIIATGSEVGLALAAQRAARRGGHRGARGLDALDQVFDRQDARTRIGAAGGAAAVAVEAGVTDFWRKYVGCDASGRHRPLRRIGAGGRAVQAFRLHAENVRHVRAVLPETVSS
jgi:transketolase